MNEEVIYRSETITPEQQSLLDGNNPHQYTAVQELSESKDTINSPENQENQQESLEDSTSAMIADESSAPQGVDKAKWDAVVDHLEEIVGAENVITDTEQMRQEFDYLLSEDADLSSYRQLKTSKGEVYGFTYNGKIYLDPTTMNIEAPIHEYTELWSAVIEKQNPELWTKGKELLKQT